MLAKGWHKSVSVRKAHKELIDTDFPSKSFRAGLGLFASNSPLRVSKISKIILFKKAKRI